MIRALMRMFGSIVHGGSVPVASQAPKTPFTLDFRYLPYLEYWQKFDELLGAGMSVGAWEETCIRQLDPVVQEWAVETNVTLPVAEWIGRDGRGDVCGYLLLHFHTYEDMLFFKLRWL